MIRLFRHYVSRIKLTLAVVELLAFSAILCLAEYTRYIMLGSLFDVTANLLAYIVYGTLLFLITLSFGMYHSEVVRNIKIYLYRLILALICGSITIASFLYFFPYITIWRSVLLIALVYSLLILPLVRLLILSIFSKFSLYTRILVLGSGEKSSEIQLFAKQAKELGLQVVDVVGFPGQKVRPGKAIAYESIGDISEFVLDNNIETIVIVSDEDYKDSIPYEDLIACKLVGVTVEDVVGFYEQVRGYVEINSLNAEWIIYADGFQGGKFYELALKRLTDIATSVALLIVASPLMLITALLIKATSFGPVFYRQDRVGLHGKEFNLLKFRSMKIDAESENSPQWAQENDPRTTLIGSFIRKVRIDELPQVLNVLKGDMSFVGPRPERKFFVDQFERDIPFYKERHYVKPGITGWAQLKYPYGASAEDARRKLEYDLYYIKNYSLFLDLLIILQTVRVVLFPKGVR